jgi:hypothetical protein
MAAQAYRECSFAIFASFDRSAWGKTMLNASATATQQPTASSTPQTHHCRIVSSDLEHRNLWLGIHNQKLHSERHVCQPAAPVGDTALQQRQQLQMQPPAHPQPHAACLLPL